MRVLRPIIDMAMTLLLLLSMAYELVGPAFAVLCEKVFGRTFDSYALAPLMHEAIGAAFILLVLLHLWLNRYWLKNIFRERYNATRCVLTLANVLLIVDVAFLLISGVMMSRALELETDGMDFARTAHILASYWGYALMSFHIGLYGHVMSAMLFRRTSWGRGFLPHAAAMALMSYGAYAFVKRQIGEYMFLRSQFVFFDFEEPILCFFADYIAVMILFACLGHYLILAFRRLKI